jgi:N-acetyl-1-D-myo-inositol-2-amino-2-deoxy-alpha-D-glucopyranoside deacetylase
MESQAEAERPGLGSTVIACVFAALLGAAVGMITTFTHRQLPPWGAIAGLLIIGALVMGFRLVFDSRIVAGAAALGVLAAIAVLALPGAGGSVVVADGWLGYLWVFGAPAVVLVALAWPRVGHAPSE